VLTLFIIFIIVDVGVIILWLLWVMLIKDQISGKMFLTVNGGNYLIRLAERKAAANAVLIFL